MGIDNEYDLTDAFASPVTGLLSFPGIGDEDFVPEGHRAVEVGNPESVDHMLWGEFLDDIRLYKDIPRCWKGILDLVTRWLTSSDPTLDEDMREAALNGLKEYLTYFVPLHLAHLFMGKIDKTNPQPEWWKGR